MTDSQVKGIVFNIQKFSVHDGEGIRTIVFFKGCPLRCQWCSNPESQSFNPERAFNSGRCLTASVCGRCLKACPTKALTLKNEMIMYDRSLCNVCGLCVKNCPAKAQLIYGYKTTVGEIMSKVRKDEMFYARSGGGLTLSGGEALGQMEFALALLREAHKEGVQTAIETCGCYPTQAIELALPLLDEVIFDVKCMDSEKHRRFTGTGNERILQNVRYVFEHAGNMPVLIRTPVIPGFNDSLNDIMQIRRFIPLRPNIRYEILNYHRMGQPKYAYLGRPYMLDGVKADEELMNTIRTALAEYERTAQA